MDPSFRNRRRHIANALNDLENTPELMLARSRIKASQSDDEIAFNLLDANLYELFVKFFLGENMMQIFSRWKDYCEARLKSKFDDFTEDCATKEDKQYFSWKYDQERLEIAAKAEMLHEKIIQQVRKHGEETAQQIEILQKHLEMISKIK